MLHIERFVCNPFQENTYIVYDETKDAVVIDCGAFFPEERKVIVNYIRSNALSIKHLISTHAHIDHNFGNNTITTEFGVYPEVCDADMCLMDKLHEQAVLFANIHLDYELPIVGRCFSENDTISFGNHEFTIITTPGHTPGSVFFYCKEENVAFSGDTLFKMSIGRTDLEFGNYKDIKESLQKIFDLLPNDTVVLSGHGPQTTIKEEKKNLWMY